MGLFNHSRMGMSAALLALTLGGGSVPSLAGSTPAAGSFEAGVLVGKKVSALDYLAEVLSSHRTEDRYVMALSMLKNAELPDDSTVEQEAQPL